MSVISAASGGESRAAEVALSDTPDTAGALRRAWPLVRVHRRALVAAAVMSMVVSALRLAPPLMIGRAVDAIDRSDRNDLVIAGAVLIGATVLMWGAEQLLYRFQAGVGERVLETLRNRVTAAMFDQPLRFFDRHDTGQLTARVTTDVASLAGFVRTSAPAVANAVVFLVIAAVVLSTLSWQLTLAMLSYGPFLVVTIRRFRRRSPAAYRGRADAVAEMTAILSESIAARATLAGVGAENTIATRTGLADKRLRACADEALHADNLLSPLAFGKLVALAVVVLTGGMLTTGGASVVSVGTVAAFAVASRQLFDPLDQLTRQYGGVQQARSNLARILELVSFDEQPAVSAPHRRTHVDALELRADNVSFRYSSGARDAVDGVSLVIPAGQTVALVGATGSGKSTLATLLSGIRPTTSGTVSVGMRPVDDWDAAQLRANVCVLPQRAHLIGGTVADNLRFVPGEHSDDALWRALQRMTEGRLVGDDLLDLDTPVDPGGTNLSAGERQLIALARIELIDPAVLVLDEATADVDPATESMIVAALDKLFASRTVVVIAHRPATAARCERVVEMSGGRVVADTHAE